MSRPRGCQRCGGYECTIECETTLERIERAYYGSAGGSTLLDNADLAFLLRIARAAERLGRCLQGWVTGSKQADECRCDGCDLRRALEGDGGQ